MMRTDVKKQLALRVLSTAAVMSIVTSCAATAFAGTYHIEYGDINVKGTNVDYSDETGTRQSTTDEEEIIITGSSEENTVSISNANVTLKDLDIDVSEATTDSGSTKAALTVSGNSTIELEGDNTLKSGDNHAGLEKVSPVDDKHPLTIKDDDNDGKLTAVGGSGGAGIGGKTPPQGYAHDITITGGDITAIGGKGSAGIGGAGEEAKYPDYGCANATVITISGENTKVNAVGGEGGSGIGAGYSTKSYHTGNGGYLTIKDGAQVTATGGKGAAGIGGGDGINSTVDGGQGFYISISGEGTTVEATGGEGGAGIGGGQSGLGADIEISDGANVTATGNGGGAGIGGGLVNGDSCNKNSGCGSAITVSGENTQVNATGNGGGAGIGGGKNEENIKHAGRGVAINITGGTVTATGNDGGAGIGGGAGSYGYKIGISGGDVTANGSAGGAGIGGGANQGGDNSGDQITISGGKVTATGDAGGAGIGGGNGNYGKGITITAGIVNATGGAGAAGIGSGANNASKVNSSVTITGGTVTATGGEGAAAGIGAGENDAGAATVTINTSGKAGSVLDVTAVAKNDGEAISGGDALTMEELGNAYSGIVKSYHGSTLYNTVHNGKYVGMDDNNADEHKATDAHRWAGGATEIIQKATPTQQGTLRHHCAVDGCKGYYDEPYNYVEPDDTPTTPDVKPDTPATPDTPVNPPVQDATADTTPADSAVLPGSAQNPDVLDAKPDAAVTPANAKNPAVQDAKALPQTGSNWLAVLGSALSGAFLMAVGFFLNRKRGENR